ncbi:MAG: hypothetical protein R3B49_07325 [Phycisphaerales bacterium]
MTIARTIWAMLAAAGALASIGGCGRDASTEAVYDSEIKFTEVAGGTAPEANYANKIYGQIETILTPHAGKGAGGDAASILLGAAQHGQAATAAHDAAELEAEVRHRLEVIRGQASEWSRLNAQAEAAASYDPTPELADIDEQLLAHRRELSELEGKQRDAQARLADLQAQIDDLQSRAATARSKAGEIQLEMTRVNAQRAAELAPSASDLMSQADKLELESQRVQTMLEQFAPEAYEIDLGIARLEKQRELLTKTRTEVTARARAAQEDEQKSRAAAEQAADRLRQLVSDLQEFRAGEYADTFDKAAGLIQKAARNSKAAQTARRDAKDAGAMTAGMAQQALGELELRRAQSALMVANSMDTLAALGVGGHYTELAEETRQQAEQHHEAAVSAFQDAATSYRAVRIPGSGEQLQQAADMLDRYAQAPLGEVPDLNAPPEPEDDGFGDDAGDGDTGFGDADPGLDADQTEAPDADDGG